MSTPSPKRFTSGISLSKLAVWDKMHDRRVPLDFAIELTARCNNDCRHCYINLPAGDSAAKRRELSVAEIGDIAGQAVKLGSMWCLISGGEPLLRADFFDAYLALKRKGLIPTVFTNACLVTPEHIAFFKKYPPLDMEVTVYGVSQQTYEAVTRKAGSFAAFRRGLDLLLASGIKVRLKAMALRSNVHELPEIAAFCRAHTSLQFRFDPVLHLRYDGDARRNAEIKAERLSPADVVEVEQADAQRASALQDVCDHLIWQEVTPHVCDHLFHCGTGNGSFAVSYDGLFRLCFDLWHPDCVYDLRKGSLSEAWNTFAPAVRQMTASRPGALARCKTCAIPNLCMQCPAHAYLESGALDEVSDYFCRVAHARAAAITARVNAAAQAAQMQQGGTP